MCTDCEVHEPDEDDRSDLCANHLRGGVRITGTVTWCGSLLCDACYDNSFD